MQKIRDNELLFLLPKDILLHHFPSFLCFETIFKIKLVSRDGHKYVEYLRSKNIFRTRVLLYLEKIGFTCSSFCEALKYSKSVISGSFLLSIILNQFFGKDQDLDIFSPSEFDDSRFHLKKENVISHIRFTKIIADGIKSKTGSIPEFYSRYFQNQITMDDFPQDLGYTEMGVRSLPAFYMNNFKIQHNIVNGTQNLHDWIQKEFDFDFLKIIFDGNQFIIYHANSVVERKSMYCPNRMEFEFVNKRTVKYTNRGFSLFPMHSLISNNTYQCKQCRTHPDNLS